LRIYCDNSTTVIFSKSDKYVKGAKHMDLRMKYKNKKCQLSILMLINWDTWE